MSVVAGRLVYNLVGGFCLYFWHPKFFRPGVFGKKTQNIERGQSKTLFLIRSLPYKIGG